MYIECRESKPDKKDQDCLESLVDSRQKRSGIYDGQVTILVRNRNGNPTDSIGFDHRNPTEFVM